MKTRIHRLIVWLSSFIAVAGFLVLPATSQAAILTVPPPPARTASMATWQQWAAQERAVTQALATQQVPQPGCTIDQVTVLPVTTTSGGSMPAGLQLDDISIVGTCAPASTDAPLSPSGRSISPNTTPSMCQGMNACQWDYSSPDVGYIAVGTISQNGNNYLAAAFTVGNTYGSYTGHVELGQVISGCSASGSDLLDNGPTKILSAGQYEMVKQLAYGSGSVDISSTWWDGSGSGPYTNNGTVCGTFSV